MHVAVAEAEANGLAGGRPIGAVVAIDGQIIARGPGLQRGPREAARSQLWHAELCALLSGGETLWEHYARAILVTTVEPCPLCLGAAVMADVPHIVFALDDHNAGSRQIVETIPYVRRHIRTYLGGVMEAEARAVFERFDPGLLAYIQAGGPRP